MCFRPAEITMKTCPQCGATNKPVAKVCAECGAELDNTKIDFDADQAALDAANMMPRQPQPPAPSGAPKPPEAPRATPKPPSMDA